ncbi:DUF2829 domain-containing protein [Paraburkholderia caribensis]|uniref:DUF2829 domain-containing protein n=1 Tax=Paraburkholderia caribensis TaxID=75105 RepID=UPI001CAB904E|nr:DUF2829 domain-containing protein [Paraburkholderia caribensis]CAG9255941.1 conserved hypothetical protein [Paraburkholderia caribensis]
MKRHIGTKIINAKPMTRGEYNTFRGWTLPADEKAADEGYLVEYTDGQGGNVAGFDGYVSWSPKDVFEQAYRLTDGLTFGLAIEALKKGERVARSGWNGKGMWLALSCNGTREVPAAGFWAPPNRAFAEANGGKATVLPSITMKTATGEILMGWLASQTDMLADDWLIVE